jgi:HSP20 family protein
MTRRDDPFGDIERMFEEMSSQFTAAGDSVAVDVVDEGDRFVLRADLPGYDADDIDLQVSDGRRVHLEATRSSESEETAGSYVTRERHQERISRTLTLPDAVAEDEATASYNNGVLTVELPKEVADDSGTDIPVS